MKKYQQIKNKKIEFDDFKELKLLFKEKNKMLYNLFEYLDLNYNLPGTGIFKYISFRSAMSIITSLIVSWIFGGKIINLIQKKQIGEQVRRLGLEGEASKKELLQWVD